jgi:very-short-patch-repair endonuclease
MVVARQHGLLSRSQALEIGVTPGQVDWLLKRGSWGRILPSVYRAAAAPLTWQQPLMAASLWADGKAAISGQSAAALWEFEGYWRRRVELSGCSDLSPPAGVVFHQVKRLPAVEVTTRSGIRVTSAARTILDLTPVVPPRTLERTLDEALRKGHVTVEAMLRCIARNGRRGRERIARLASLLAERRHQSPPDSELESDVAALIREHGIAAPVKRHRVIEANHFIAEVDLAWPSEKVAVQVHGSSFHRQPRTWENDQRVENRLQLHGWLVAKVTRRMLEEDPGQCVALVARALSARRARGASG